MSVQTGSEGLEQIRERLRGMSDSDLLRYGQASRHMADPRIITATRIRPPKFSWTKREWSGDADTLGCR
jgi:hypothetical protein